MGILSNPATFIEEVRGELLKVTWPTKNQTVTLTVIVLAVSLAVGLFIGGLDYLFTKIMEVALKN